MTKIDLMRKVLEPIVRKALYDTYGMRPGSITGKQMELIDQIWEGVYEKFSPHLSCDTLKEIIGDRDEISEAVQKD